MLIQAYSANWTEDFNKIKAIINEALIHLKISIEHVGSTSVPQLAAKPIIDISIVFDRETAFDEIRSRLEKIGYYHNGDQGIPDREVFKRNKVTEADNVLDDIVHHLYVCKAGCEALQRHLLFRDYLIANEEARIQYQQMKYQIAEEANQDRKTYAALKELKANVFITSIVEKAKKVM
jgi:GrpB-like predicted nucleotidyltransferase (UPF0157 family)